MPGEHVGDPALLLCRTPFQAWLLSSVVEAHHVYDLAYVTRHDAPEDRHYFSRLATGARRSTYLHEAKHRRVLPHSLAVLRQVPCWVMTGRYARILLASIDSPAFRRIVARHREASVFTFDDGAESLLPDPFLMRAGQPWRDALYGRLLGGGTVQSFRKRIDRHFTVFGNLQNVVPTDQAVAIAPGLSDDGAKGQEGLTTFFIGQPFEEVFSADQVRRIRDFASSLHLDYYVGHPRESAPLLPDIPLLKKGGSIAEDAILTAARGTRAKVVAAFSTVLFTLPAAVEKIYMNVTDGDDAAYRARVAESISCRCVDV